ncbi:MAG: hypothetical protein P4L36_19960 [Holophaga sp.]|nr:hypothetical protein [Holophaga sp.]
MTERTSEASTTGVSRGGFLGSLVLLAGALGLGFLDLGPILKRSAGGSAPPPRPAGRPSITPPHGSVKRRV